MATKPNRKSRVDKVSSVEESKEKWLDDKKQNKILKIFFIVIGVVIIGIVIGFIVASSQKNFEYRGVNFSVVKFCDAGPFSCLKTYNTKLPVIYNNTRTNYNFYLRNDPRELEKRVPFNGNLSFQQDMLVKITFNRNCQGFEQIAVVNFLDLHKIIGLNISSGENSTCDLNGKKMFVLIQESPENKTYIEQTGPACYNINIKNCEILAGTERFMVESFVKINEKL